MSAFPRATRKLAHLGLVQIMGDGHLDEDVRPDPYVLCP
jgi:hypothetical protein